tara:strand:- start:16515 stop:16694 length:180 start_codon:yes stop_codon:yes gene_type:complete
MKKVFANTLLAILLASFLFASCQDSLETIPDDINTVQQLDFHRYDTDGQEEDSVTGPRT